MDPNAVIVSRPRAEEDWKCPRRRFWRYEYKGQGIVLSNTSLELFIGTIVHDSLAGIAKGLDIEDICQALRTQAESSIREVVEDSDDADSFVHEQSCLVEGLVRGFHRGPWQYIKSNYPEIVAIEQDMIYHRDDVF